MIVDTKFHLQVVRIKRMMQVVRMKKKMKQMETRIMRTSVTIPWIPLTVILL